MLLLKTILDLNQLLIGVGVFVCLLKTIPMMIKHQTNSLDLEIIFKDKWVGLFVGIIIINTISYFILKDTYIVDATNELKESIAKNDSLFFSDNRIYLDTNKIYPCDYSDRYVENSMHTLVLSDNTVITLQQFRNDTTKYGINIVNQVGFFNHNPIAIFKVD
ncbi:hypothetical protein NU10_05080 [Flavobacterium dauae]|uniref:hypothetical protein n=1 Tax=Flavobacterium dauae TaxID=1563479 RepID=UPI00101B2D16|nr:hypothetical protein [Flavobacterium dauae]WLD24763.1 hypothetical protein NU10_05080 [Flavobacterium dauae]